MRKDPRVSERQQNREMYNEMKKITMAFQPLIDIKDENGKVSTEAGKIMARSIRYCEGMVTSNETTTVIKNVKFEGTEQKKNHACYL